jgi:hypothetical protein
MPAQPTEPWTTRIWREFRAGNLTRAFRDTLLTLGTFRGTGGLCIPSHATLAVRAKVGERTVRRALDQARDLGLVTWSERRIRRGWRWLRTSNAYRLLMPGGAVQPGLRQPMRRTAATAGQPDRGGESLSKKAALEELLREAARLPNLLAMRRAAVETQLAHGMAAS